MVRGVTSFNPTNKVGKLLLKAKSKGKTAELPAKVALGAMGTFGIANSIKESVATDSFVMKCSDYDGSICGQDYMCPSCYP